MEIKENKPISKNSQLSRRKFIGFSVVAVGSAYLATKTIAGSFFSGSQTESPVQEPDLPELQPVLDYQPAINALKKLGFEGESLNDFIDSPIGFYATLEAAQSEPKHPFHSFSLDWLQTYQHNRQDPEKYHQILTQHRQHLRPMLKNLAQTETSIDNHQISILDGSSQITLEFFQTDSDLPIVERREQKQHKISQTEGMLADYQFLITQVSKNIAPDLVNRYLTTIITKLPKYAGAAGNFYKSAILARKLSDFTATNARTFLHEITHALTLSDVIFGANLNDLRMTLENHDLFQTMVLSYNPQKVLDTITVTLEQIDSLVNQKTLLSERIQPFGVLEKTLQHLLNREAYQTLEKLTLSLPQFQNTESVDQTLRILFNKSQHPDDQPQGVYSDTELQIIELIHNPDS